ncbi:hypothetical protein D6C86_10541 [Aureobasidium pullulans]|nr:hypothetical protein D6C86_10541 [Aureobasidium pullulans]
MGRAPRTESNDRDDGPLQTPDTTETTNATPDTDFIGPGPPPPLAIDDEPNHTEAPDDHYEEGDFGDDSDHPSDYEEDNPIGAHAHWSTLTDRVVLQPADDSDNGDHARGIDDTNAQDIEKDPTDARPLSTRSLSWTTADQLREKMENIPTFADIGQWQSENVTMDDETSPSGTREYVLRYRDPSLSWRGREEEEDDQEGDDTDCEKAGSDRDNEESEAQKNSDKEKPKLRRYTDMASGDWWWNKQVELSSRDDGVGGTIVPIIIASDKTQLTLQSGDLAAHAVYMTVGNLNANARHSNKRPGSILLALLPILHHRDHIQRARAFHMCLDKIFREIGSLYLRGTEVECADGYVRRCFPTLAAITTDYEEQVLLTGVLSNKECPVCKIHPNLREDLEVKAEWRTMSYTWERIQRQRDADQRRAGGDKNAGLDDELLNPDERINDVNCFAFYQPHFEINHGMTVDILHQLLKGVMVHMLSWIQSYVMEHAKNETGTRMYDVTATADAGLRRKKAKGAKVSKPVVEIVMDRKFASMPGYPKLRVFKRLSSITQWTGAEYKSILRQILPVFVPILEEIGTKEASDAIKFIRATVDFIMLAMYRSHDDETLRYFDLALFRMNEYKEVFRRYRNLKSSFTINY